MVYYKCTNACYFKVKYIIKQNLLDILFNRSLKEKTENYCHYICLKELQMENIKRNGRWGFCPVFGMTEFCSTLFSFINLLTNIFSFKFFLEPNLYNLKIRNVFELQSYIQNAAFVSSTLFHIHENCATRFMDYFCAVLVLLFALYMSLMRILLIFDLEYKFRKFLKSIFVSYFIYHLIRMSAKEFDYVYNKISCIIIIALTFMFHINIYMYYKQFLYAKYLIFFTLIFFVAGYIEIQDIPPYSYILDSHAIWHFFGILSTPFYVKFWGDDIKHHRLLYNNIKMKKKKKTNHIKLFKH